ncbi:MAG: glycosyltransferase family 1 protein [Phenylobacterium sp.]|nr:MAG: glycosyltransferase family 1 protein [Phenylobacterium sp.]
MSRPLNILALVTDAWGGRGGIAQYNRDFLGALAASSDVGAITVLPRQAPDAAAPPAGVKQLPARRGRIAYSLAALSAAVAGPVDVVFCGHLFMAPLARVVARMKGARLVIQTHGVEAWPRPKPAQRAAVEAADLVLSVSRYTRAAVQGWATLPPERLVVVPNTVGEAFTPGDGSALRKAWGLEGKRVLLTVGRMDSAERYKGHDRVIAALPELAARHDDLTYVIVGDGDDRPRLEALARDAGLGERVKFMGAQPEATKLAAYRMADLFVMPSTGEGFGIVFLEAMACGTPALGLAAAGAVDALGDGELGIACSPSALPAGLAAALVKSGPSGETLAKAVQERFGQAAFRRSAAATLGPLSAAAS